MHIGYSRVESRELVGDEDLSHFHPADSNLVVVGLVVCNSLCNVSYM